MLHKIRDSLLALAYPQACHGCHNSVESLDDGVACRACWAKTRIFSGSDTVCHKCGRFLSEKPGGRASFCHQCDDHLYDAARAVGLYENALQASVLSLKNEPFVAARLRRLFIRAFANADFNDADRLIPVPLSKKRRIERGFNQAAVLARVLAAHARLPIDEHSLTRAVHTPVHRAGMDNKARALTVKNAFQITRPKLVDGARILLIDDIFTSGATASACAEILKSKGADKVYVLTLARAF